MELTPICRIEKFLDAIINSTTPPEPMFRVEYFLAKIGGADVVTPEPMFRIEKYLAKILGEDVEIPEPMFRTEFWLAKKCGEDVETPDPAFRVEYWLEEWCGGSAPTYETITGKIVSFLTQRIAPLKIEASLEPIQDLHGYENPWPGGGGKNKLDYSTATISNTVVRFSAIALVANQQYQISYYGSTNVRIIIYNHASGDTMATSPYTKKYSYTPDADVVVDVAFYDSDGITAAENLFQLESGSTVSTFSPYSNICPISGHTGAVVNRTGKNIWDDTAANWKTGYYIDASGNEQSQPGYKYSQSYFPIKPGEEYTLQISKGSSSQLALTAPFYDASKNFVTRLIVHSSTTATGVVYGSFTVPDGCYYVRFTIPSTDTTNVMLELGSTASAYEPFSGSSVTISFGSTVYGGTLTVNEDGSGQIVADRAKAVKPSHGSVLSQTNPAVTLTLSNVAAGKNAQINPILISNACKTVSANTQYSSSVLAVAINLSNQVRLSVPGLTTKEQYTAWINDNDFEVVYPIDEPVTIPLTPGQVNALQGNNTVWVDSSVEIKVTFRSN